MTKIEPLAPSNWSSLVQLFKQSPECSDCWCMNHRSDPKSCPTGDQAQEALKDAVTARSAHGLLAYVGDKPAGWCAVDPVKTQIGHDFYLEDENARNSSAWMIHCLYVAPPIRGAGVSKELIKAAIEYARTQGASELLAFPIPEDSQGKFPKNIAEFSGRLSSYLKQDFTTKRRLNDFYQIVSKSL